MIRYACAIFLFFLGLYGLTFHGYVDIDDVEVCYQSTRNLVENGSLSIGDSDNARRIAAEKFAVYEGPDGATYPIYPVAQLLAPVPLYMAGKALSEALHVDSEDVVRMAYSCANVLLGALICAVVFLIGVRLGHARATAATSALLAGCCSMLWVYAQGTFADVPLTLCVACAGYCLLLEPSAARDVPGRGFGVLRLLAAGFFQGLAILFRPTALLLVLPSLFHLRGSGRLRWVSFLLPIVLLLGGAAYVDLVVLGRPPAASYAGALLADAPVLTNSYTLSALGLLFSDGKGLFMLSPILFLAILAFPALRARNRAGAHLIVGYLAVLVLFIACFDGWYGGWCWGPRYLLPTVPFIAAALGTWLERSGAWRKALTVALVLVSLWIQLLSVAVPHRIYMSMVTSHGADLSQFFYYTRFSPVLAHQKILVHKLSGGADVYSQGQLFGEPDTRAIDVTVLQNEAINRFNRGFDHFAWVRVYQSGQRLIAIVGILLCLALMLVGAWWLRRATRGTGGTGLKRASGAELDELPTEPSGSLA